MKSQICQAVAAVAVTLGCLLATLQESAAQELSGIKCVVSGERNASAAVAVEYRNAKVYLCCKKCKAQFEADPASFATRANHQLVLTSQYQQTGCPISSGELDPQVTASVGGTKVSFCCQHCLKEVTDTAEMPARAEMIFGDVAFEKSFTKVMPIDLTNTKCVINPELGVSKEIIADYQGGKVFFCCESCASAFTKDPSKHATAANHQLVQTGQFVQVACPLTGNSVEKERAAQNSSGHSVEVAGVKIHVCCNSCVQRIGAAADDQTKLGSIFGSQAFDKAFTKRSAQLAR